MSKYGVFFWFAFSCIRTVYRKIRTRKLRIWTLFTQWRAQLFALLTTFTSIKVWSRMVLTHFIPLLSFYTPWKHQESWVFSYCQGKPLPSIPSTHQWPIFSSLRNQSIDFLANHLTGFYMRETLLVNRLTEATNSQSNSCKPNLL